MSTTARIVTDGWLEYSRAIIRNGTLADVCIALDDSGGRWEIADEVRELIAHELAANAGPESATLDLDEIGDTIRLSVQTGRAATLLRAIAGLTMPDEYSIGTPRRA